VGGEVEHWGEEVEAALRVEDEAALRVEDEAALRVKDEAALRVEGGGRGGWRTPSEYCNLRVCDHLPTAFQRR
jgi:hypothetical protein